MKQKGGQRFPELNNPKAPAVSAFTISEFDFAESDFPKSLKVEKVSAGSDFGEDEAQKSVTAYVTKMT